MLNDLTPSKIKLLGIGGGNKTAFEYRLALILGATVGIVEKISGSGLKLLQDPSWQDRNLSSLEIQINKMKTFFP